ncbi:hypothetical protein PHMEG_00015894 [Phytophthora megakarya]|uniref:Uncharacterized protein n=1 Tax=Phytophthora megakarya TaxID=4795 RepID=A0A225W0L2_9STRA|nr:hypothetical protein PHMEG_00015894 [Phytophthora megakarya]
MVRNRFEHIMPNLHFTNNADVRVVNDRAWTIRSVVEQLQNIFPTGIKKPLVISFDEGIKNVIVPNKLLIEPYDLRCLHMTAALWWGRRPVLLLETGRSREMDTCRMYIMQCSIEIREQNYELIW